MNQQIIEPRYTSFEKAFIILMGALAIGVLYYIAITPGPDELIKRGSAKSEINK